MFKLAKASPAYIAEVAGTTAAVAEGWIETARLATLRGMGSGNLKLLQGLGIRSVADLAAADWRVIDEQLEDETGRAFVDARVRVWIRGAKRELEKSS
jgi:hypothetical protein